MYHVRKGVYLNKGTINSIFYISDIHTQATVNNDKINFALASADPLLCFVTCLCRKGDHLSPSQS